MIQLMKEQKKRFRNRLQKEHANNCIQFYVPIVRNFPLDALSSNIEEPCCKEETFVELVKKSVETLPQICYGGSSNKTNVNICQKTDIWQ